LAQGEVTRLRFGEQRKRFAVVCDFREENWPSMDLVAEKLTSNLEADYRSRFDVARVCPPLRARFGRVPVVSGHRLAFNADRLLNRLYDYPRYLTEHARSFDLVHVCDHSYANVVHRLPAHRTGVFCHDLDTFRSILEPDREARPHWFREMARHILRGMQKAALVFYTTSVVREQIERHGLVDPARLVQARYGVAEEFNATSDEFNASVAELLKRFAGAPFLLHVGSCIPRKRIDVLLDIFAMARRSRPELRLLQVGGQWSHEQSMQLARLGVQDFVCQAPRMAQAEIAQLYRLAALVLMPSEAEGFGLPVVEALACGSIVVASDIPVFREVGGTAAVFCPLADVELWSAKIDALLASSGAESERAARLAWAAQFTWAEHTRQVVAAYQRLGA
jgi:glycosyltransferase involved in cell wall biosynthesis